MSSSDQLVDSLIKLAPIVGSLVAALVAALLWVGRLVWSVARKLAAVEAMIEAQTLEQRSLQDQLRATHERAEANRALFDQLASDVLRQAAEHTHRAEIVAMRLQVTEERTREALTRLSDRARKHSTKLEAVVIPPLRKPPGRK